MAICIVTSLFHHEAKNLNNLYKFIEYIKKCNLIDDLFLCEVTFDGNSKIDDSGLLPNHYVLKNSDPLWHKESCVNYVLKRLPEKYDKIIVIDNDITFSNPEWIDKAEDLLDHYLMIQLFDFVKYYGPDNVVVDYYSKGTVYHADSSRFLAEGNPGICVGYRREYLEAVGGLFDKCLVGGGDVVNLIPFYYDTHSIKMNILSTVFIDHKIDMIDYFEKAFKYIVHSQYERTSYIDNCVALHMYHGTINNRQYTSRYKMINELSSNYVSKQDNILYSINNNLSYSSILRSNLLEFFNNRMLDPSYNEPCIFNTNKYSVEDNILWLGDYNYLTFKNIVKVKFYIHQPYPLKYLRLVFNDNVLDDNCIDDSILELENPKILEIDSDYFVPRLLGYNADSRKLSMYISKIEIIRKNSAVYEDYPLTKVF